MTEATLNRVNITKPERLFSLNVVVGTGHIKPKIERLKVAMDGRFLGKTIQIVPLKDTVRRKRVGKTFCSTI